ncbi:Structure-specific endonuclease subunit SLX1 [Pleurostoma richardsiae]|uniref:Structure-specific endonuclease subunit SLX1 n=1 Tax=Pleurostoma richardsiae TaxID=41990 RepID=A0AA38RQ08_9PEZI|nr:Structure-specific endonuclease subunit SLX1 [Pleurostoma richardsiae]
MAAMSKPIPALYTVYILRSTVRHASLYIGSTPHPPRRLKQHNGEAKGGAARTARASLRPWEMVGIVSGFPSMVAALKFEWALTNPHLSLHIPSQSRIAVSAGRKKNGHPRRPRACLVSVLSNLHLLLRVPSFARWPLRLHFFAPEVHAAWETWCGTVSEPLRKGMDVVTDFGPGAANGTSGSTTAARLLAAEVGTAAAAPWGIHALPLDHTPMKDYLAKSESVFMFEREGSCVVCGEDLAPGQGLYAICSHDGCEGVGHLDCWSRHLLHQDCDSDAVVPLQGHCPKCDGEVQWADMMKELTLRTRGQKEVAKLLKKAKKGKAKETT